MSKLVWPALLMMLGGCKPKVSGELPICAAEVAGGVASESAARELEPELWYSILLQDFDRTRMLAGDSPNDCSGSSTLRPTRAPTAAIELQCPLDDELEPDLLEPTRALTDQDVVIGAGPNEMSLVWVQSTALTGGEAIGPVALVEWTRAGVAVRALGILRAPTTGASVRIESAGDLRLLVVEAETCDAEVCVESVRLLPLIDGRFVTVPLELEASGPIHCLGEAEFALHERHTSNLPDGWIREFEIVRSLNFEAAMPRVAERVVIRDRDPNQPDAPALEFREASNERALVYMDGRFVTQASLWDDMIRSYGSVAHARGSG